MHSCTSNYVYVQNGVTEDPDELRKLYKDRGNAAIGRFTIQLFLDAVACFAVRICRLEVLPPTLNSGPRPTSKHVSFPSVIT